MNQKKLLLEEFAGRDLAEIGLSQYIHFEGLSEKRQKLLVDNHGADAYDMYFLIDSDEVNEEDIEDWSSYSQEWDEYHFKSEMDYLMETLFEDRYTMFLVHSIQADWRGNSYYRLRTLEEMKEGLFIQEDSSIYLEKLQNRGKVLKLTQYHHDVPQGHPVYVIGLTHNQAELLTQYHDQYERQKIKEFAESYCK